MGQVFDERLIFSKDQAVTDTAASTDVLDMENRVNIGAGKPIAVVARLTESFATLTSLDIQLQDSADDSSFATVASTGAVAVASLTAGAEFRIPLPATVRRYVRLNYVKAGTNATAGKVYAGLVQG